MDLKPNYEQVDEIKYDIIACPDCGYAALGRYFGGLTARQIDEVRNKICMHYKAQKEQKMSIPTRMQENAISLRLQMQL